MVLNFGRKTEKTEKRRFASSVPLKLTRYTEASKNNKFNVFESAGIQRIPILLLLFCWGLKQGPHLKDEFMLECAGMLK